MIADWLAASVNKIGMIAALFEIIVQVWSNLASPLLANSDMTFNLTLRLAHAVGLIQILSSVMFWAFAVGLAIRVVRIPEKL